MAKDRMSDEHEFHGWEDSPSIREALKTRHPSDIALVHCDRCGSITYYNQGSHCTCEHCDASLDHLLDSDLGMVTTLDDHWECLGDLPDLP